MGRIGKRKAAATAQERQRRMHRLALKILAGDYRTGYTLTPTQLAALAEAGMIGRDKVPVGLSEPAVR